MATSSLFTVIVLLGLCSFTAIANQQQELQLSYIIFNDWISQFNKQYGIEEMAVRFTNWKSNSDLIQEHNAQDLSWKLAMNDFGDMTSEEFSALHLGLNVDIDAANNNDNSQENTTENNTELTSLALPRYVDWRKQGKVTSVKNQGQCGGCWAFAASGALEGLYAIRHSRLVSLSVQQMLDCASSFGNNGCGGGLMTNAYQYTHTHGIELESGYRYTASVGDCKGSAKKTVFKNIGYRTVGVNNALALKHAVARQPVSVGIQASSTAVQLFKSGVI